MNAGIYHTFITNKEKTKTTIAATITTTTTTTTNVGHTIYSIIPREM